MKHLCVVFFLCVFLITVSGLGISCSSASSETAVAMNPTDGITSPATSAIETTVEPSPTQKIHSYSYEVVNEYPHDRAAFTQGLVFENGNFYEGTGRKGQSTLRRVDLETGQVLQMHELPDHLFGEGIVVFEDRIVQLTWRANIGFVYHKNSFELLKEFTYPTEGWGITHDGNRLIMSDGTSNLYFRDPHTLEETGRIKVLDEGVPVVKLNELEYINGEVWANVWQTNRIIRIDPETGTVLGRINLEGLLRPEDRTDRESVLNGIAYDTENDRLFVTGKLWPKIFEIRLIPIEE